MTSCCSSSRRCFSFVLTNNNSSAHYCRVVAPRLVRNGRGIIVAVNRQKIAGQLVLLAPRHNKLERRRCSVTDLVHACRDAYYIHPRPLAPRNFSTNLDYPSKREEDKRSKRPSLLPLQPETPDEQQRGDDEEMFSQGAAVAGDDAAMNDCWRPMTLMERVRVFPTAMLRLYHDWLRYRNIIDASRTKRNAWTISTTRPAQQQQLQRNQHKLHGSTTTTGVHHRPKYEESSSSIIRTTSRIPRRQREQQRRFRIDIGTALPVGVLYCIPVIGYVTMLFSVLAPRQLLSRQFHNDYEIYHYAEQEYRHRSKARAALSERFRKENLALRHGQTGNEDNCALQDRTMLSLRNEECRGDAAGPVIDLGPLYHAVLSSADTSSNEPPSLLCGMSTCVDSMSRSHLVQWSLAVGMYQTLPTRVVHACIPTSFLRRSVRAAALCVAEDDAQLLLEGQHDDASHCCAGLTAVEVLDACQLRGLPVLDSVRQMRICLTNHLRMVRNAYSYYDHHQQQQLRQPAARSSPPAPSLGRNNNHDDQTMERVGLLTLHLPVIRHCFQDNTLPANNKQEEACDRRHD